MLYPASRSLFMSPGRQPKTEVLSARLSETGKKTLEALQDYYGISQSSVLEMILRDRLRELKLELSPPMKRRRS